LCSSLNYPPTAAAEGDWNCGKVDWNVPEGDKELGTAGKLEVPNLEAAEFKKEQAQVGKLKNPFAAAEEAKGPPPKRSWKKK